MGNKILLHSDIILFSTIFLLSSCNHSSPEIDHSIQTQKNIQNLSQWKVGAKIHFEEESGKDYIGLKEINTLTRGILKSNLEIAKDVCADNAKILLKRENDSLHIDHYTEKSRPTTGEEMHATLLYTTPRGFCDSETLKQTCYALFDDCTNPIPIEKVAERYQSIFSSDWRLKISDIVAYRNKDSITFSAHLLCKNRSNIYFNEHSVSSGLHLTLIQCFDPSILDEKTTHKILENLKQLFKDKFIKIASKNGVVDLEFGISGQPWRMRAGHRIEF